MELKSFLLIPEVKTLVDAVSECMRYWVSNCDTTHMCVGSTVGPNIFIKNLCLEHCANFLENLCYKLKKNLEKFQKKLKLINCVGGGSSAMGFWNKFMDYDRKPS